MANRYPVVVRKMCQTIGAVVHLCITCITFYRVSYSTQFDYKAVTFNSFLYKILYSFISTVTSTLYIYIYHIYPLAKIPYFSLHGGYSKKKSNSRSAQRTHLSWGLNMPHSVCVCCASVDQSATGVCWLNERRGGVERRGLKCYRVLSRCIVYQASLLLLLLCCWLNG